VDEARGRAYARSIVHARWSVVALAGLVILAGCAHARSSPPATASPPPAFTVGAVRKAFAAAGLPLTIDFRSRKTVFLSLSSFAQPTLGDVSVSVFPRAYATGELIAVVAAGHRLVRVRNVTVDFAPRGPSASRVRAALAMLRRP
jgi:hypothetical protein